MTVRYMMFITHREDYKMEDVPQSLFTAMDKFIGDNQKSGVLIDTAGLQRSSNGVRVRLGNKKITVTDGPFSETKEVVGGYALVEAKSKEEVVNWAQRCPAEDGDVIEIRQIFEAADFAVKK